MSLSAKGEISAAVDRAAGIRGVGMSWADTAKWIGLLAGAAGLARGGLVIGVSVWSLNEKRKKADRDYALRLIEALKPRLVRGRGGKSLEP
jgi:hypothetical protein